MSSKLVRIVAVFVVILVASAGAWYKFGRQQSTDGSSDQTTSHPTYRLVIQNPLAYAVGEPNDVSFQIKDNEGQILKDIESTHGDRVHVVVVRKDRTQFQYLAADYQESNGTYTLRNLTLPTDGEYRLFVDFTPKNAGIGPEGLPLSVTTYADLTAGDVSSYQPKPIGSEQFKSSANGFDINIFLAPHDPSDPGLAAGSSSSFAASVNRNGTPYTELQQYKESRGSMMLFGPDLEYVHAHSQNNAIPDTYVLSFTATFPTAGSYKAFLQTKADNVINSTEYILNVAPAPNPSEPVPTAPMGGH